MKNKVILLTQNWIRTMVVGLNLCPFAKREIVKDRVRYSVLETKNIKHLLLKLKEELELLSNDSSIETTLLIHPNVLQDFYAYNDFLEIADNLLINMDLDGIYQIASFHPDYQFNDIGFDDVENFTNRSPYPMLHILRESSLKTAIKNYPNTSDIPEQNIKTMNRLGRVKINELLKLCLDI